MHACDSDGTHARRKPAEASKVIRSTDIDKLSDFEYIGGLCNGEPPWPNAGFEADTVLQYFSTVLEELSRRCRPTVVCERVKSEWWQQGSQALK